MQTNLTTLFNSYLSECQYVRKLQTETIRGYREVFSQFIKHMPEVADTTLFSAAIITEFLKRIQTKPRRVGKEQLITGLRNSTVRTYWSKLFSFCNWLTIRGLLPENPMRQMRAPSVEYLDSCELTKDSLQRLLSALMLYPANTLQLKRDVAMFYTLIFCGLRKNEFINLQIPDIDLEKCLITIRATTSKSKKPRSLPLHPTLRHHLKEYLEERKRRGFISPSLWVNSIRDRSLTVDGLKHWIKRLISISKIKLHLHQFRHTFACNLARQNVNVVKIQKLLGHADVRMTMTYLRSLSTEDLRNDIEELSLL